MNPLAPRDGGRFNSKNVRTKIKRIVAVLIVGLLLIAGAGAWLFFQFARPIGSGPAGPAIGRGLFSSVWTSRPVLFVGLGDSVTAGFGARKGYSYFDRMAKNPTDEFPEMNGVCLASVFPKFQSTNLSVSGSTSSEVPSRQLNSLPTNAPEVLGIVVMTTGGNDIIHNHGHTPPREEAMYGASIDEAKPWVENFGRRLDAALKQINSRFPGGCEIFLANIFDPTDGLGDAERAGLPIWKDSMQILDAYNTVIRHAADAHPNVHVVDIHDAFLGHGIHCTQFWRTHFDWRDPHYWYYVNLEDPNERGYDVIRRLFLLEMAKDKNRLK
jgi:lysophospholipase L1-like esterase